MELELRSYCVCLQDLCPASLCELRGPHLEPPLSAWKLGQVSFFWPQALPLNKEDRRRGHRGLSQLELTLLEF